MSTDEHFERRKAELESKVLEAQADLARFVQERGPSSKVPRTAVIIQCDFLSQRVPEAIVRRLIPMLTGERSGAGGIASRFCLQHARRLASLRDVVRLSGVDRSTRALVEKVASEAVMSMAGSDGL